MRGRVFITGDKHGTFTPLFGFAERTALTPADILIIAGDAGYIWDEKYPYAMETLRQIFPGEIAFVDGNHENHALLGGMEICIWNGGRVHRAAEGVYHMMRGEVYSIYGENYFAFGGARSVDKDRRREGVSWWKEEEPSPEEVEYGRAKLMAHWDEIDYVVTHESPLCARAHIAREKRIDADYNLPAVLEGWYRAISGAGRLKKWYFGHMHEDRLVFADLRGIYQDILRIGEETPIRWA